MLTCLLISYFNIKVFGTSIFTMLNSMLMARPGRNVSLIRYRQFDNPNNVVHTCC